MKVGDLVKLKSVALYRDAYNNSKNRQVSICARYVALMVVDCHENAVKLMTPTGQFVNGLVHNFEVINETE